MISLLRYANYRLTKEVYKEVAVDSSLYAIDCEMCLTTANESELTRITVVNEKSEVHVYTTFGATLGLRYTR